jgi:hypothetical protein
MEAIFLDLERRCVSFLVLLQQNFRVGGLKSRNLFSYNSISKSKILAGLDLLRLPFLASGQLPSLYIFTWPFLSVCVSPRLLLFYKNTCLIGLGSTHMNSSIAMSQNTVIF